MTNANPEFHYDSTHHPSDDELVTYLHGRLPENAYEWVQSHLVECDACLEQFRDMQDFFDTHRKDEQIISEDISHEWSALWNRIKDEEKREGRLPAPRRERFWRNPPVSVALAAMLLVALAIGVWAVRLRRQKQELTRQLESAQQRSAQLQGEQQNLAERLAQTEQEKLGLQERVRAAEQSPGSQRVESSKPELNVPIYDLYAVDFSRRSGNTSAVNRIKVPSAASSIVLILNGEGLPSSSSYGIEILGNSGQVIWRAKGLRKGNLGNFTMTMERTVLRKGTYRLKLYGGGSPRPLAEYVMLIE
jgi:hypothetical protein